MSPENMWLTFACVAMSAFGYAFLKPMIKCSCCEKKPDPPPAPRPESTGAGGFRTIKIHPERAKFRLFPPGEAYYVGGPPKKTSPVKKKKKKKSPKAGILKDKFKAAVTAIVVSNSVRDSNSAKKSENGENHFNANDPEVFTGSDDISPTNGASRKGGKQLGFAGIVQLKRALMKARKRLKEKAKEEARKEGQQSPDFTSPSPRPTSNPTFERSGELILTVTTLQSAVTLHDPPPTPPSQPLTFPTLARSESFYITRPGSNTNPEERTRVTVVRQTRPRKDHTVIEIPVHHCDVDCKEYSV